MGYILSIKINLEDFKNIVYIAFLIITGTITILAYKRATKTILQPIKTEVFKEQIKELSKVLEIFNGKGELELREDFALEKIILYNSTKMIDNYAILFFDVKINDDKRPYFESKSGLIKKEAIGKHFKLADGHIENSENTDDGKKESVNSKTAYARWTKYDHPILHLSVEYENLMSRLSHIKSNPLLPEKIIELIGEYEAIIGKNLNILSDVIVECSKECPDKYPSLEELKKANFLWIHTRFNNRIIELEEKAKEITSSIRSYFQTDELLKL